MRRPEGPVLNSHAREGVGRHSRKSDEARRADTVPAPSELSHFDRNAHPGLTAGAIKCRAFAAGGAP
jgi:hypothetical protein